MRNELIRVLNSSFVFVFLWFNAIFQHNIGYTWQPVLMVEEEPGQPRERTTDIREVTGKLSHITTFANLRLEHTQTEVRWQWSVTDSVLDHSATQGPLYILVYIYW